MLSGTSRDPWVGVQVKTASVCCGVGMVDLDSCAYTCQLMRQFLGEKSLSGPAGCLGGVQG